MVKNILKSSIFYRKLGDVPRKGRLKRLRLDCLHLVANVGGAEQGEHLLLAVNYWDVFGAADVVHYIFVFFFFGFKIDFSCAVS